MKKPFSPRDSVQHPLEGWWGWDEEKDFAQIGNTLIEHS